MSQWDKFGAGATIAVLLLGVSFMVYFAAVLFGLWFWVTLGFVAVGGLLGLRFL